MAFCMNRGDYTYEKVLEGFGKEKAPFYHLARGRFVRFAPLSSEDEVLGLFLLCRRAYGN